MAWYNNNWDYRKKLTIDSSKVSGNVSSIPIYIDLADLGSDFFTNAKSDGSDIVITSDDGETKLSRDLVSYDDGAETGEIHFNAPSVSGSTDTDFYIYYGYSSASETNDLSGTWGANTDGVYHLQSDASDSSGNSSDGTVSGATNVTSGKIYSDYSFDGTNDYISTPIAIPAATSGTLASYYGWVYNDGSNNWRIFGSDASSNGKFHLGVWGDNTKVVFSESYYGGAGSDGPDTTVMAVSVGWHHAAIVKTAAYKFDIYFDGVKVVNQANRVATIGTNFNIGRYYNVTYYLGENDEIVVTDDALTADEVNTIYNNQNDTTTFFTVGDEEEHGTVKVLVVAGGGAGGGGGGGAGGYRYDATYPVSSGTKTVTIGAGGAIGATAEKGSDGANSVFNTITSTGGGAGAAAGGGDNNGNPGGSGGGGFGSGGTGGDSDYLSPKEGYDGGAGNRNTYGHGGGGGGASEVGEAGASGATGKTGGDGTSNSISGGAVYYAGGGGGAGDGRDASTAGAGGSGGGGDGAATTNGAVAESGGVNTGGGGGGASFATSNWSIAGPGGSGVVIVSYATDGSDGIYPGSTGGTKTTSGDQTIHTFTSSGSFVAILSQDIIETESIEMSETITKTIYKELTESVSLDDDVTLPGIVSSKCVYNNNVNVNSATLTVTYTTKVGTPKLMLSNDNGVTWETVTSGVANVFSSTGTQVKYKIRASSGNIISKIQTQIN